ncbi:hypothetical protein RLOC_00000151 [Lonchura striata]|uniref:Uncharacterized protein n=1 Tax=Lonchura striata TaxID=40157 RepID=A0A218V1M6_9PASE|nr:hypothetical protein RLOC_00000151 [Lonchura striata domestica]
MCLKFPEELGGDNSQNWYQREQQQRRSVLSTDTSGNASDRALSSISTFSLQSYFHELRSSEIKQSYDSQQPVASN